MSLPTKFEIEDVHVTEKQKSTFEYLSQTMDYHIAQLVRDSNRIKKCRNLYEGVRDKREFKYLESTFGIETPLSVKMTPLIKTRIDVLLGLLLDEEFSHKVTANDTMSFDKIEQEKKDVRAKRIYDAYNEQIRSNIKRTSKGEEPKEDIVTKKFNERLDRFINEEFISSIEIAAQHMIKFYQQDPTLKLKQKLKQFFLDLLVTGEAYYRTSFPKLGADPELDICKPENVFYNKNTNDQFLKNGNDPKVTAVVIREYMKRGEILTKFGHLMTEEQKTRLYGERPLGTHYNNIYSGRDLENLNERDVNEYQDSNNQYTYNSMDVYPVYFTEFLANNEVKISPEDVEDLEMVEGITHDKSSQDFYGNKVGDGRAKDKVYRLDRYEGVRIGHDIYLEMGKSKYTPRSIGQPYKTTLSTNGVSYNDRNGRPYSIAWALRDIQNSYDIVKFFRDNLIANSGVNGSRINLAAIPKVLGQDFMERLMKFMALRKQGIELIDPTEDGAALFSGYGDFKNSLDGNVVQSLKVVLEGLEQEADIVTGINRHMYQAAEQRDAVNNVKVGIKQTSLITKDLFELVTDCHSQILVDLVNLGKITYKKGKRGSYVVGKRQVIFDIIPDNFCFTDYNIQVVNSSKENNKLATLASYVPELIGKGTIEDDVLIKMTMMDSTTEILALIESSMAKKAEENDQVGQLSQQLEQLQEQLNQATKELEESNKKAEMISQADHELKVKKLELDERALDNKIASADKQFNLDADIAREEIQKDKAIVQLEREQLYMESSGNAKEIKNNI